MLFEHIKFYNKLGLWYDPFPLLACLSALEEATGHGRDVLSRNGNHISSLGCVGNAP